MGELQVLVTCGHLNRHIKLYESRLHSHGVKTWVPELKGQQFTAVEMLEMIPHADIAIAGDDPLDAEILMAGKAGRLKGLVRWGIGTDNVDKPAATRLGLPVYNTPGMFNNEVADLALGHVLNLSRHIHKMDRDVRQGKWTRYEGGSLSGKTAGIVGLGGIGRETARRCAAFGMRVIGSDVVSIGAASLDAVGARQVPFDVVVRESDIIILACALTPENFHLLNADVFSRMKRGVVVVNVARGAIIDETALIGALASGHVAAAGLDVFEVEPLPSESPLRQFDNCLFGTHSGSSTLEAIQRTNQKSIEIALAMLGVNSDILATCNRVA
ncbi:phosphoglycerate dehydrogenase [Pararhizobium sp. LjRoot235]|uniref:phosphoglycerate dehydrogenase n=1 Tax=Pararhizobium sp. LjRoot235 TaxID=3342291 RepID=UPI003ED0E4AB